MGLQSPFQCSANDLIALLRTFTEVNVPHRMTFRAWSPCSRRVLPGDTACTVLVDHAPRPERSARHRRSAPRCGSRGQTNLAATSTAASPLSSWASASVSAVRCIGQVTVQTGVVSTSQKRLSVVFVCTGNICRSPMAEIVFAEALRSEGLAHRVQVSSAGTGGWHIGDPADPRTAEALRRAGYACAHVAAQLGADHLSADLLVALDHGHLAALRRLVRDPERVVLLRSFDRIAGRNLDVPDPYYGGRYGFDDVLSMVRAAMPGLLTWVRERV